MTTANIDGIKRKLRGLFAKADANSGATEAEMASSLALAKKLMAEWSLTSADIELGPTEAGPKIVEARLKPRAKPPYWEILISCLCNELFSTQSFTRTSWVNGQTTVCFVGTEPDVAVAIEAYSNLKAQLLGMTARYQKEQGCTFAERCHYGQGVVNRLITRVRNARYADDAKQEQDCRALVVQKTAIIKTWMDKELGEMKSSRRGQAMDHHTWRGWDDGAKVSLGFRDALTNGSKGGAA